MKNFLVIFTCLLLFMSCETTPAGQAVPDIAGTEKGPDAPVTETDIPPEAKTLTVLYISATVYAGATDYLFKKKSGEEVVVRVNNLPEEREVKIPDNMLGEGGEEGPPEANAALVGKVFLIVYDVENPKKVTEIRLKG